MVRASWIVIHCLIELRYKSREPYPTWESYNTSFSGPSPMQCLVKCDVEMAWKFDALINVL